MSLNIDAGSIDTIDRSGVIERRIRKQSVNNMSNAAISVNKVRKYTQFTNRYSGKHHLILVSFSHINNINAKNLISKSAD